MNQMNPSDFRTFVIVSAIALLLVILFLYGCRGAICPMCAD